MRMVPDRIAMSFPIRTVATKPELTDERCSWTIGATIAWTVEFAERWRICGSGTEVDSDLSSF